MRDAETIHDIAVIGAGMAGASVAAELAKEAAVLLLEMENQPGYHTTGRSAALFVPGYGPAPIRALTRASAAFFHAPPGGFCQAALLSPRDIMMIARADQVDWLDQQIAELSAEAEIRRLNAAEVRQHLPLLRQGYAEAGYLDRAGSDIDVAALHQGYLGMFKRAGGRLVTGAGVNRLEYGPDGWRIFTANGTFKARKLVNAAGAWADQIGALAGAEPIGLVPKRRTALIVAPPAGIKVDDWPMVADINEEFYMKPDAGRLLISPANEDPEAPGDVQPDEMDVAICVDRIERAFDLTIRRIENKWAGLRSFVADKSPVAGFAGGIDGFFWLAGQGGYGIQTAPALSRLAAALVLGKSVPADILDQGLDARDLSPDRSAIG
ncbi:MAG: FAD-binding oxidoreductase [Rhodobacteraceae bacterium]|nr:FAD-binding oxidoreductase [Paracoccaceae bacterium]